MYSGTLVVNKDCDVAAEITAHPLFFIGKFKLLDGLQECSCVDLSLSPAAGKTITKRKFFRQGDIINVAYVPDTGIVLLQLQLEPNIVVPAQFSQFMQIWTARDPNNPVRVECVLPVLPEQITVTLQ